MRPDDPPPLDITRRSERIDPIDSRRLRAAIVQGEWVRVHPGAFLPVGQWRMLRPVERHRVVVDEALRRRSSAAVVSHASAAAVWGIDLLGRWPTRVHVSCAPATGGRSSGLIHRHPRDLDAVDVVPYGPHFVTTAAQTAVDLARALPFVEGVAVVDQAIRSARAGGPLTSVAEILRTLDRQPAHPGDRRARRAVASADPLAANVRETQSRVEIVRLGFPRPRLQERRVLRSGRLVFGDFFWPEHEHWGELDGHGKYLSPDFGAHRSADEIVVDEKRRENEIRREVRGFSRWEPADADVPRRLYDILAGDGLPSALPRP